MTYKKLNIKVKSEVAQKQLLNMVVKVLAAYGQAQIWKPTGSQHCSWYFTLEVEGVQLLP